mgnify:FL=1
MSKIPKAVHKVRKSVLELMDICSDEFRTDRRSYRVSIRLLSKVLSLVDKLHPPTSDSVNTTISEKTVQELKNSKSLLGVQMAEDFGYEDAV